MYPDDLDRLAARLNARVMQIRQHAADHQRRGQETRWMSTAAQAYRERAARDRADTDQAADALDRAAADRAVVFWPRSML